MASVSTFTTSLTSASDSSNLSNEPTETLSTPANINMSVCGVDIASPPYFSFSSAETPASEENSGITYDYMKEVSQQLNINIKILRYPWKRCLSMLKRGTTDGVVGASFIDERKFFGHYPTTPEGELDEGKLMFSSVYWLYTNSPLVLWDGTSLTLPGDGIAATTLGYSSVALLQKLGLKVHEEYLPSQLVSMLMSSKRTILIAGYEGQLEPLITERIAKRNNPAHQIEKHPIPLAHDDMYLLISKPFYQSHKEEAESIWDLFGELHENGRYDKITEAYFDR